MARAENTFFPIPAHTPGDFWGRFTSDTVGNSVRKHNITGDSVRLLEVFIHPSVILDNVV